MRFSNAMRIAVGAPAERDVPEFWKSLKRAIDVVVGSPVARRYCADRRARGARHYVRNWRDALLRARTRRHARALV